MAAADNYALQIQHSVQTEDWENLVRSAKKAFGDERMDEDTLAWIAGIIYENKVDEALDLLPHFVDRYPESLHLIRVYIADMAASQGKFDHATDDARFYLRQAQDTGVLDNLENSTIIQEGVSRAILLLTAAYTEVGARSYSQRVLKWGLTHRVSPAWKNRINEEIFVLGQELKKPDNQEIDSKWEKFFKSGSNKEEIIQLACEKEFNILSKRAHAIANQFDFNKTFQVNENEILKLLYKTDDDIVSLM